MLIIIINNVNEELLGHNSVTVKNLETMKYIKLKMYTSSVISKF